MAPNDETCSSKRRWTSHPSAVCHERSHQPCFRQLFWSEWIRLRKASFRQRMARCRLRGCVACGCGCKQKPREETMQRGSSGNTFVACQRWRNATICDADSGDSWSVRWDGCSLQQSLFGKSLICKKTKKHLKQAWNVYFLRIGGFFPKFVMWKCEIIHAKHSSCYQTTALKKKKRGKSQSPSLNARFWWTTTAQSGLYVFLAVLLRQRASSTSG